MLCCYHSSLRNTPEGRITINSIFQWRTPGLQVINWPQIPRIINSRAKNCKVVVFLLLRGMPPAPPHISCLLQSLLSLCRKCLWQAHLPVPPQSPLPAVAGFSPPSCLRWLSPCWFGVAAASQCSSLCQELWNLLFSHSGWKLISALYHVQAVLTKQSFVSIYLSEAGFKNAD